MSAWVTLGEFKLRIGNMDPAGTHKDDDLYRDCLDTACDFVEAMSGRTLISATYTRRFDGNGKTKLPLPVTPVTAVSLLQVGTSTINLGTAEQYAARSVVAYWTPNAIIYPAGFTQGYANIKVTWTAGYAQSAIPDRYKSLAIAIAAIAWKERDRWGDNQKNFSEQSVMYDRELKGMDKKTFAAIRDWRSMYVDPGVDV